VSSREDIKKRQRLRKKEVYAKDEFQKVAEASMGSAFQPLLAGTNLLLMEGFRRRACGS
jgi:hypothetical protein